MEEKSVTQTAPEEELRALGEVAAALGRIDAPSARRVLQWASERFGVRLPATAQATADAYVAVAGTGEQEDLPSFFARAAPKGGPEQALVVGYYQQIVQGAAELDAQALNFELKHLGHKIANITTALSALINQKPSLIIQTKKMGKGQQARKRYKLTNSGMVRVREMLARAKADEGGQS